MTEWKLPWKASCLCGQVQMRVSAPPIIAMACHCTGCQKLTSGAYSLTLMIPGDGLAVEGATELGALRRPESQHHYCPRCKSWLYTTSPRLQGMVNFRPTMLEDASWVAPYIESWVSEKLPGVVTGAKHSFDQFPSPDQYPELMAAFAREGARPS
jgi:hypothetical protein